MTTGEMITRGSAWLAFAAYISGTVIQLRHPPGRVFRWLWLAGAVVLLLHLLAAFQFKHHWSHADALADTARQTQAVTGLDWGGGIYLNYLLVAVWLADAAGRFRGTPPRWLRLQNGFYAFMWFNAAVLFVPGPSRWVGAAAFVGLLLGTLLLRSSRSPG